jgi:DNA repair protein RadC
MRVREMMTTYRVRELVGIGINGRIVAPAVLARIIAQLPTQCGALEDSPVECFGVVLLTTKYEMSGFQILTIGTLDATVVHPRDVFGAACRGNAAALAVFHNHPSGDPAPSHDDRTLTSRLVQAGVLMGIPVIDHVIIGHDGRYYSFKEKGDL